MAAAATEVELTAIAGFAGLLHPVFAAELTEGRRFPNFAQALVVHIVETQSGNDVGGMARKSGAVGRNEHELTSPATDAGLGELRVVIRNNKNETSLAHEALFGLLECGDAIVELRSSRKQMGAIGEAVAVILNAGKFDAAGGVFFNER